MVKGRFENTSVDGVKRDTRSGVFYFRDTVNVNASSSAFIDRSLKTKSLSRAKELATEIRNQLIRGEIKAQEAAGGRHTFDQTFDLLMKIQRAGGKAKATGDQAGSSIKHLRPWFTSEHPYLDEFEKNFEEIWAEYCTAQAEKAEKVNRDREFDGKPPKPPRKLGHDRRYLVMALKRAHVKGWVTRLFTKKDFPLLEASETIGKYVEDADVKNLLKELEASPKTHLQALMAVTMGMRISEILHIRVEEVDLKSRQINLDPRRTKTRKPRKVPIPISNAVYDRLKERVKYAPGPYVFPAVDMTNPISPKVIPHKPQDDNRYHWDRARELSGVDCRFHDLRHTAITNALDAGMPPLSACKIFGATMQVIERIYDHLKKDRSEQFRGMFDGRFT